MAVEPHKHCPVCGTPIPMNEKTCSPECDKVIEIRQNQARKSRIFVFVLILIFVAVWAYVTFLR
jgi:predicted nucleic acid-binding Zn ribbon protein